MSKINVEFKLKDLYAIKHGLENQLGVKYARINELDDDIDDEEFASLIIEKVNEINDIKKDIKHEEDIVSYIVEVISKYKKTEAHLT